MTDDLVPRDECKKCGGTGNEYIGIDDTGQECTVPYCDYCSEMAKCRDCSWVGPEGERLVATLDQINGAATGFDLLCPKCGGNFTELTQGP